MKLKLDENLDVRLAAVLRRAGHEVSTVRDQGLAGVDDEGLYAHCASEARILVSAGERAGGLETGSPRPT